MAQQIAERQQQLLHLVAPYLSQHSSVHQLPQYGYQVRALCSNTGVDRQCWCSCRGYSQKGLAESRGSFKTSR